MKTIWNDHYRYLGVKDGWHVFECVKEGFDKEILLVERAMVIGKDGFALELKPVLPSSQLHFNMEGEEIKRKRRMQAYSEAISKSVGVKPFHRKRHIPKEVTPDLTTRPKFIG